MINIKKDTWVDMEDMLGNLAVEYKLPFLRFEQVVEFCFHVVRVYNLDPKRTSFTDMCEHMQSFALTPFGKRILKELK